ncbi:hypothetical protein CFC21_025602 [Triticum aestivum]|uniref:Pentatricopeptide repeat-containing protein n=2 Tax=Triticum aestivum TaxID=4565 RepID=A0A9R1JBD6_WHEAT|nr:hypothetical protein CFC21_025602 [Triticum aestivum]
MARLTNVMGKFNQMIAMEVQPNTAIYHSLIRGLCLNGDLVKAKELVSEMMNKGMPRPSIVFFTSIINNLCKYGRVMDAHAIFDFVIDMGERPYVITFGSLIDGYCLIDKMGEAPRVLDSMISVGIEPNAVTCNTLINGYSRNGRIDDAWFGSV